jgi:peptidyl-dipeptidase Dcp
MEISAAGGVAGRQPTMGASKMIRFPALGAGLFALLTAAPMPAAPPEATVPNPLLAPWTGPHGGVPPFDKVEVALFEPALEAAMAEQLAEVERIANDPAPPTFENTLAALERSGDAMDRVGALYSVYSGNMGTPEFQAVQREMSPRLAAFNDQILQNEKLFARVAAVYDARGTANLTPEQKRLAWYTYTSFVRAGAKLDAAGKKRVGEINQRLATLFTTFNQNLLADETDDVLVLEDEKDLAGLPDALRAAAAGAAEQRGHKGKWAILNTRSSMEPFLTYSDRRDLRQKVWTTYYNRGDHGDAKDNNAVVTEILKLRAERAKLLGYETHAHWRLQNTMAGTPERALELL